jgi:hypothetical protein
MEALEPLLISNEDCLPYVDFPENIRQARMDSHIRRAQRRLKPLLGAALYAELLRRKAAGELPEPWLALYSQAVPALAYASLAQYWPFSQTTVTANSIVRKTSQYSEPISDRTLATQASIFDGEALSYEVELRTWLIAHASSFTGFYPDQSHCNTTPTPARTATVVVQAIGRPTYR